MWLTRLFSTAALALLGIVALQLPAAARQVSPGDPSASALPESPGSTGTVGNSGSIESVIPVGPGPSFPRVPRGITQPPEPFGVPGGLGIEPLAPPSEAERPLAGRLGLASIEDMEATPGGITIDQAIERVLRMNLELRAQAFEIPKARADVLTASLRGNPLFFVDSSTVPYGNFRDSAGGPNQFDANITLPLDLNNKRKRRIEAAVRAQEVTEALYQDAVRLQLDNLYTAWIDVLAAQVTIRFLEAGRSSLEVQLELTEQLVAKGASSHTEVNNIEIQIDSTELTLLETRETYDDAKRTLAALLSLPEEQAETFPMDGSLRGLNIPPPPIDWLIQQARECRPDLGAFRLGVLRARAEVNLAKASRLDDLFLLYQPFTAQRNLEPGERTSYSWALGVTVPLPVFNRNQGNIARANQTVTQTQTQVANLERQVLLEVQRAEAAYSVTLATIKKLEEEILPAARENLEMSLAEPGPDEPGAISRIEAQRSFAEISRQYLEALIRHRRSMFRLNTAVSRRVFP